MKRGGPIKRTTRPKRTRLSPVSKRREAERATNTVTREFVFARDRHRCQLREP